MLINLHVKNLALIEEEDIDFNEGLNILSGETGAGKSIILGSINAALGEKTSPDFIRSGCEYGLSEVTFAIPEDKIDYISKQFDIDLTDGEIIISRKIMPNRSTIKVNGQSFSASEVRQLATLLIDIHGQHDNQLLMDEKNHLSVVDEYGKADISALKKEYSDSFSNLIKAKKALEELSIDEESRQRDISFLEFEINEIESANLKPGEDEEVELSLRKLQNYQKIADELGVANNIIVDGSDNLSDMAGTALKALINAAQYDESLQSCCDILGDVESLISDLSREISNYMDGFTFDQESFNELEKRSDLINTLKMKYGKSIDKILLVLEEKKAKYEEYINFDEIIVERRKAYEDALKAAKKAGDKLSKLRKEVSHKLIQVITDSLLNLNFLDVRFDVDFKEKELSADGLDEVRFMISTNPGEELRPLAKIASGGELSRIMLAIKSVMSDSDENKALIFDEIDAGISGKTAGMVANKLKALASKHQIICITHLPQIAAMADYHYIIEKSTKDNRTISNINRLSEEDSIMELARMLGGETITEAAINNAKELKHISFK